MFKCLCLETEESVIILASRWRSRLAELRRLDVADKLVCQGCKQPVRIKAGMKRRWHFAHKHLHNCPFESSSPALIYARGILYEWLVNFFGEQAVDIEVAPGTVELPRPVDVRVDSGLGSCVFWLIETRMKPLSREQVRQGLSNLNVPVVYIFLEVMRRPVQEQPGMLYLTTTERDFASSTEYDLIQHPFDQPQGQSLHYLDASIGSINTYRDLVCIHKPQVFRGRIRSDSLENAGVDLARGSIVHQGESTELQKILARKDRRQVKINASRKLFDEVLKRMLPPDSEHNRHGGDKKPSQIDQAPEKNTLTRLPSESQDMLNKAAVCMFCGQMTDDWWYLDRKTGSCKCRTCLKNGVGS